MGAELLSSKMVVQEEPASARAVQGVATAVGASVGITEKGPIGVATLSTSFAQWKRVFGGDIADGVAAAEVRGFFENGGRRLWFTRTVHYTNVGNPATKTSDAATLDLMTATAAPSAGTVLGSVVGPFSFQPAGTLIFAIDGGADDTATFDAARARVTAGNSPTYALSNGDVLTVKIDGGAVQTITFLTSEFVSIGAATTAEVNAVINAKLSGGFADVDALKPRINSDKQGTDSHVEVTGGTANVALGFSTVEADGTGDVADIEAVTVAEIKAVVEADVTGVTVSDDAGRARFTSNTTGPTSSVQVKAASTLDDEIGVDNAVHSGSSGAAVATLRVDGKYDGTYANDVTILISEASSGQGEEFNLSVLDGGAVVEVFPNLTMDDAAERYAESVVNDSGTGSQWIQVTDLDAAPSSPSVERPADSPGATPVPFGPLSGGVDGLVGLADADFVGDEDAKTGIRSFDLKDDVTLLFVPDRPTPAVHAAMVTYCEVTRAMSMFAVIDPPSGLDAEQVVTYVESTASLLNLSEFGAVYWPHVKVVNPSEAVFGSDDSIVVPPSGLVAGLMSRVDSARVGGVYDPPGGTVNGRLFGVVGFETEEVLEERRRDMVYPKRINPITRHRGQPIAVDGVRTLKGDGNFPTVAERRGVIFIEQSLRDGLQFARLRNNDEALRAEVARTCTAFLLAQMRVGAFRSKDPEKAFFVDVSEAINPPSEQFAGKLNVRIGLATQKPAEFVVLSFSQDTRALDEELAAAGG